MYNHSPHVYIEWSSHNLTNKYDQLSSENLQPQAVEIQILYT